MTKIKIKKHDIKEIKDLITETEAVINFCIEKNYNKKLIKVNKDHLASLKY